MTELAPVALSALASAVLTGAVIWVAVIKDNLTKKDHETICAGKQELVFTVLQNIKDQLEKQDKKLDRLLFKQNGGRRGEPTKTS